MIGHQDAYHRYFDSASHWGRSYADVTPGERKRVDELVALLPDDVGTILDAGCGDGLVTNILVDRGYTVVGADISAEALRHVRAPTVQRSTTDLQFDDRSFDCVLASNVLEHLPHGMFEETVSELGRVAARYLVFSFPDREDLVLAQTRCSRCQTIFHPARHVRSIGEDDVASWFPDFAVTAVVRTGEPWRYRSRNFQRLAQLMGNCWYRLPDSVCPGCGYRVDPPRPIQLVRAVNGVAQRVLGLVRGSRPSQLLVLLARRP